MDNPEGDDIQNGENSSQLKNRNTIPDTNDFPHNDDMNPPVVTAMGTLAPDHRLLKQAQDQLYATLMESARELDSHISEQKTQLKRSRAEREDVGVFLFSYQEKYKAFQTSLQNLDSDILEVSSERQELTEELQKLRQQVDDGNERIKTKDQIRSEKLAKFNEISRTIRVLNSEKDQAKHEISVTKRAASKAEQVLKEKEEEKIVQDLLVDSLNLQIDRLEAELRNLERRIENHRVEENEIRKLLSEAVNEIDVIMVEKRRVVTMWKGALATLENRDQAFQKIQRRISAMTEMIKTLDQEIKGYQKSTHDIAFQRDMQFSAANALEERVRNISKQLDTLGENKKNLVETYEILRKSIDISERDLESNAQKGRLLRIDIERAIKAAHDVAAEVQKTELEIMKQHVDRSTVSRMNSNKAKDGMMLRKQAQDLELSITQLKNEMAKLHLDCVETNRANSELQNIIDGYDNLINDENEVLNKRENEMRSKKVEITKKQNELEILKRKYDKVVASILLQVGQIEGEVGPLEATIHNLTKSIQQKENETMDMQHLWIRTQNELVLFSNRIEELKQIIADGKTRKSVIERKMELINQTFAAEEEEIRQLKKSARSIKSQMERLNTAMVNNNRIFSRISDSTKEAEVVFRTKLRDSERECIKLEDKVQKIKIEAQQASDNLIEAERQLLLWQQKLHIAKESKSIATDAVTCEEIRQLEYDLQKSKARHVQLLKQQDKLVQDLTFAVQRQSELNGIKTPPTFIRKDNSYQLQSQLGDLKKRIQQISVGIAECEENIELCKAKKIELEQCYHKLLAADFHQQEKALLGFLKSKQMQKQLNLSLIVNLQTRVKRFQDVKSGKYVWACTDPVKRRKELEFQLEKKEKLGMLKANLNFDAILI